MSLKTLPFLVNESPTVKSGVSPGKYPVGKFEGSMRIYSENKGRGHLFNAQFFVLTYIVNA